MVQEFQDKVRYQVNRFIYDKGFAPSVSELATLLQVSEKEVEVGLKQLADNHAIVLHPNSYAIWVAHPFALFPTLFWVESGDRKWWGNCAWCSLGIATLTDADTTIYTKTAGKEEPIRIDIKNGQVVQKDLLVHFPIPAKKLWDNVLYTCANMLVFTYERQIDEWCTQHRVTKGEVHSAEKVWELSKLWYGNYLSPDWTRKSADYAESLFQKAGFTSDFWKLK